MRLDQHYFATKCVCACGVVAKKRKCWYKYSVSAVCVFFKIRVLYMVIRYTYRAREYKIIYTVFCVVLLSPVCVCTHTVYDKKYGL